MDLDLVMPMYNLLKYSSDYSDTTGRLWFRSKDDKTDFNNDISKTNDFKLFKYKARLLRDIEANVVNGILRNTTTDVSLIYLSNFWSSLEIPLINCKIELSF